jgi:hypothetical protein
LPVSDALEIKTVRQNEKRIMNVKKKGFGGY